MQRDSNNELYELIETGLTYRNEGSFHRKSRDVIVYFFQLSGWNFWKEREVHNNCNPIFYFHSSYSTLLGRIIAVKQNLMPSVTR